MEEMRRLLLSNPQIMMEASRSGFGNSTNAKNNYGQYDEIPSEFKDLGNDYQSYLDSHCGDEFPQQREGEQDEEQIEIATFGSRDEPEFIPRKQFQIMTN